MRVLFGISCIGRHCHQVTATRRALVVLFPLAPHVFDGGATFYRDHEDGKPRQPKPAGLWIAWE